MLYVVSDVDAKFPCAKRILRPFTFVFCRKNIRYNVWPEKYGA